MSRYVVAEFCRVQSETGKKICSNGSACNWLCKHRPKVTFCPHKQDCDTCAKLNVAIHAITTTLNRIRQSGAASVEDQQALEVEIKALQTSHQEHRTKAQLYHKCYIDLTTMQGTTGEDHNA